MKKLQPAQRLSLLYVFCGVLWIVFSDMILASIVSDPALLTQFQTYKGWVYVAVTGLLVYLLLNNEFRRRNRAEQELEQHRNHLEEMVEKRTKDLLEANNRLQKEISQRQSAEKALQKSEIQYRQLIEMFPDAIIVHQHGEQIFVNRAAVNLLGGGDIRKLLERQVRDLVHPDGFMNIEQRKRLIEDGKTIPMAEQQLIRLDGTAVDVEVMTIPFSYQNENAYMTVCRDITEKLKNEQEFQKLERLESLGILAGGIAHDFNNILTIIQGNLSLIKIYSGEQGNISNKLNEIQMAVEQAKHLTLQLLTFSKGGDPVKETMSIEKIVQEAAALALSGSNVLYDFVVEGELWPVEIDKGQISQVMNNLIINAMQAMPAGGKIAITLCNEIITTNTSLPLAPGNYVKVIVADQGSGISEEHLHKIFDPYFTTKAKGSGLGLAVVYSVIKKHGGYITAESMVDEGTTFYIYLPAANGDIQRQALNKLQVKGGKGRILVMEDETAVRKVLGEMLGLLGYQAIFAIDGTEAFNKFREAAVEGKPFDIVILDLTVPGGEGGKETIEKLLAIDPDLRAIVTSGYSNNHVMAYFEQYGFKNCLVKPFEIEELDKVLQQTMPA